jgi:hypothetical protein
MKIRNFILLLPPVVVSVVFLYLYYLESFNYDNFVFANLHFNLARFSFISGIFWAIWVVYFLAKKKVKTGALVLAVIFCLVSIPSGVRSLGIVSARTIIAFRGKGYVVQKSMEKMYGNDYKFMNFVKSYLPENQDAVLILPPNTLPWRHTGNPQVMNSYLYPVTTTNSTQSATPYVLISSEEDGAGYSLWPDYKIRAEKIIIFSWEGGEPTIIENTNWDPEEWQDKKPWGLIIKSNE